MAKAFILCFFWHYQFQQNKGGCWNRDANRIISDAKFGRSTLSFCRGRLKSFHFSPRYCLFNHCFVIFSSMHETSKEVKRVLMVFNNKSITCCIHNMLSFDCSVRCLYVPPAIWSVVEPSDWSRHVQLGPIHPRSDSKGLSHGIWINVAILWKKSLIQIWYSKLCQHS